MAEEAAGGQGGLLVIAAGGTGGHMFPAQALAEAMVARGWRVVLSTDARGARYAGGFPAEVARREVASATFARGGALAKLAVPFRVLAGILAAWWQMRRDRPDAVIGFGGYPAIPAMAAAWLARLPRAIHEQNGVLGRVNALFARRVSRVACGTWPTALPPGVEAVHTGNPVRAAVRALAGAPYTPPGDWPMNLVVFGGSQGARILSDVVPAAVALLPEELRAHLRVTQQARPEDAERVSAAYDTIGMRAEVTPFIADMPRQLAEAQLVIARAGASSVADICVVGRPAIYVPLAAAIRDEQSANARGPVDAGAAQAIPERDLTPESLARAMGDILTRPDTAARMAAAAQAIAVTDATDRLVALVEDLARKGTR